MFLVPFAHDDHVERPPSGGGLYLNISECNPSSLAFALASHLPISNGKCTKEDIIIWGARVTYNTTRECRLSSVNLRAVLLCENLAVEDR